ncbi:MAG: class I SAM-dependent methyltransferase [Paracoccaceae bacterium]
MSDGQHQGHLGAVYGAKRPEEIAEIYDRWAGSYEAEMARAGYRHPTICLALLARYLPRGVGPLLDAGAGTGLLGEWLGIAGYTEIEALDLSEGMLAIARSKGIYSQLHRLALGTTLPFPDGHFAGIVSAGVFTSGHVGVEGLDELVRICRPGGVIVLTVKTTLWEGGFSTRVAELAPRVTLAEATAPYVSMPGETGTVPSLAVVLRREAVPSP